MSYDKLDPSNFNLTASQSVQWWHAVIDPETLVEDILKPKFWVHAIGRLKPMALVDLVSPDGTLDMQVRVMSVANGLVVVRPRFIYENKEARQPLYNLRAANLSAGDAIASVPGQVLAQEIVGQVPDGYKVGYNPGKRRFYVLQRDTGFKLADDFLMREDALKAAIAHAKAAGVAVPETTE